MSAKHVSLQQASLTETNQDRLNPQYKKERLKHYLRRYSLLQDEINDLTLQLRAVKRQEQELATDCTGTVEYVPHGKGGHADPTFNAVDKMIEVYQKKAAVIQRRIREMAAERAQVSELMECLSPREHEIIRLRFIKMESWVAVGHAQFLCERQCQRVAEKALVKMMRHMGEFGLV